MVDGDCSGRDSESMGRDVELIVAAFGAAERWGRGSGARNHERGIEALLGRLLVQGVSMGGA